MKGLLIKDFRFTMQQAKMFIVILFMFVIFFFSQGADSAPFIISYTALMGGMFVLTTISYDDYDHGTTFLLTLPIARKDYVKEKYVFGILGVLGLWALSTAVYLILGFDEFKEILFMALLVLAVILAFEMIMIPIQLKFGGDKGRMALIGMVVAAMLLLFVVKSAANQLIHHSAEMETLIYGLTNEISLVSPWVIGAAIAAILVIETYISYRISVKVIENREY